MSMKDKIRVHIEIERQNREKLNAWKKEQKGGEIMTGRELAVYILANGYDDKPLVTYIDGNPVPVFDVCYEVGRKELVVLPDTRTAYTLTPEELTEYERGNGTDSAVNLLLLTPPDRYAGDYAETLAGLTTKLTTNQRH